LPIACTPFSLERRCTSSRSFRRTLTRVAPWSYSKAWHRRRNEIERLFRRLKGFPRIFSRFDKLDVMFMAFLCFALVVEALR
jgi:hypothetical protein